MAMKALKKHIFEPDHAVPPGDTIEEVINSMEMTKRDFARRLGLSEQSLIRIIKGDQQISPKTARSLEFVTSVPARFWNNLEAQYRMMLLRQTEKVRTEKDIKWLATIPVVELEQKGYITSDRDRMVTINNLLSFFQVASVDAWMHTWERPKVAARRSLCFETAPGAAAAWVQIGIREARRIHCQPYSAKRFREVLKEIHPLTQQDPVEFQTEMTKLCASAGVALAFVPRLKKVPWNGATMWLNKNKAMIILSLRGKGEDVFWFSFFHEAGHVLHDSKLSLLINDGTQADEQEIRADDFAVEALTPTRYDIRIKNIRSGQEIVKLAEELGVSPGIVAGRYRFLTKRWNFYRKLTRKYQWQGESK